MSDNRNLSFLEGGDQSVSTGNTVTQGRAIEPVQHDPKLVHITQEYTVPLDTPYVQRAIDLMKSLGYNVGGTVQAVIEARKRNELFVTYHEADIALRLKIASESSFKWLLYVARTMDAYITEDDSRFTKEVFTLRARYNKGLQWLNTPTATRPPELQKEGQKRLLQIGRDLNDIYLPPHPEEIEVGFHQEFLKPEYMTWTQFTSAIAYAKRTRTMAEKDTENKLEF